MRRVSALLLLLFATVTNASSRRYPTLQPSTEPSNPSESNCNIKFLTLGDWGKGGWDGKQTANRRLTDTDENQHQIERLLPEGGGEAGGGGAGAGGGGKGGGGKQETLYQGKVAAAMDIVAQQHNISFIAGAYGLSFSYTVYIHTHAQAHPHKQIKQSTHTHRTTIALGDNFYTKGVSSSSDSMWTTFYRNVYYTYFSSLVGIPWYSCHGNHDYGYGDKGVMAQIQRTYDYPDQGKHTHTHTHTHTHAYT